MMPLFYRKTPMIQFGSQMMPTFAYAPHSTSREYTLKTQLLRIEMHNDETPDAYLNRVQEYADALAAISEPIKDKDLVMLVETYHIPETMCNSKRVKSLNSW
ncbi:hypothetical protein Tco_0105362 [Tanacetum coccineum]